MAAADIPSLDASKITSGTLAAGRGGTGVTTLGTVTAGSNKITLGGTPAASTIQSFSVDVNEGNLTHNNIGGIVGVAKGGTGLATLTTNGVLYGNGTSNAGVSAAGTAGQILMANASAVPTFTSMSGDATIASNGALTIGANKVTYGKMQAMTANKLLGSGASGTAVQEITLGTGLSFTGTTLNATGSGSITYQYGESLAASNTSSSSNQTKLTLALPAGTYLVTFSAEIQNGNYSCGGVTYTFDDGSTVFSSSSVCDGGYYTPVSETVRVVSTGGSVYIKYKSAGGPAYIRNARIAAIKVA